ncbi:BRO domain-containing protein [Pseudomonas syringae pv. japonica str. M301072]|uniref:BRO domain-containing protein n=1 Tax=Pseudomonas syringae pv. japonica str. M301072 TaxID=629262 RepID=F3FC95_PSESX|nr:BRO domain-containing protein [Pseudomonas syringae pv. japonica str. M301072]
MKTDPKLILCTDCVEPLIFIRHHRALRAVRLGYQCWFSLQDMARLMGKALDERSA